MSTLKISLSDQTFHRFGIISHSIEKVMAFAKEVGFDGLELNQSITSRFLGAKRILDMSKHYDLPITSVHQSMGRMLWSSLGSIENLLLYARSLGTKVVVVHLASVHRSSNNESYFKLIRQLEKKYGVVVAFENAMTQFSRFKTSGFHYAHDPQRFREFISNNNLVMTYDIGHMAALQPDLNAYYDAVKDNLVNIHLQDYRRGLDHLPLGRGVLPLVGFLQHLVKTNYKGFITLEVFRVSALPFLPVGIVKKVIKESLNYFRTYTT